VGGCGKTVKENVEKGVVYKTSRISYVGNYILVGLVLILFFLVWVKFNLEFTLFPRTYFQFQSTLIGFGFLLVMTYLIEEPTIERILRSYMVTNHEIIKLEGFFRKHKLTLPYASVADVQVHKGVIGRIFNFGTVHIRGFKEGGEITIKGVKNPDELHNMIKNKISLMRSKLMKEQQQE